MSQYSEVADPMDVANFYTRANDTTTDYPSDQSLHGLIAETSSHRSTQTAIISPDRSLTYGQFDRAANQLAQFLIARGVRKGDLVGVCCERNSDLPVLLNGILRAGAAYVPLDPDYPMERLKYMVEDAGIELVLGHQSLSRVTDQFGVDVVSYDRQLPEIRQQTAGFPVVEIDSKQDLAYVIYTSGSTGKPKGVAIPHRAAVNLMFAFAVRPGFAPDDRLLATTTLSFDISVTEIFLPLAVGGQTVIVDRATAKDADRLVAAIRDYGITFMQATPAHWRMICESEFVGGSGLKFISGGEPLPRDLVAPLLSRCGELWNCFGPTEGTVWTSVKQIFSSDERITIGKPLANTRAWIVDENGCALPPEAEGELWIGGDCVAMGYLNRPELTRKKFVDFNGERAYRTGDLGRILDNGEIEHLGRIDNQVKLHGHRIELGEIESAMMLETNALQAAAIVRTDARGGDQIVGYLRPRPGQQIEIGSLRQSLLRQLPDYMVPSRFQLLQEFPETPSGKVDRNAFPEPSAARPEISSEFVEPHSPQEKALAAIWREILGLDQVGVTDNFFELGGNSIRAAQALKLGNEAIKGNLPIARFFEQPTIEQVIAATESQPVTVALSNEPQREPKTENGFAVVGMAARLPGAENVKQFWDNLVAGRESIRFFEEGELDNAVPLQQRSEPNYVKARGIVDDADCFDAKFFGVPPREAELIDPQQRLMLELAWTAMEDAGCVPDRFAGTIGVWAGTYETSYFTKNLLTRPDIVEQTGEFQLGVCNEKDYIATRVAHKLNLTGPAINVNTACSTSLVTIIQACGALAAGQCDAALAGGVSIHFPQQSGHFHQEGSIFSPDGHCRPFDADAAGTLFSDGAGVVLLKRLDDAVAAGDYIYAVVKGIGINNDGGNKASFSAPSIEGQSAAIAMAHRDAGVDARSIGYVEAHGTATPIGDPIEVAALSNVFHANNRDAQFCGLGSVKSNFGHTVAAAGITGFIKTVLALHNEQIPATLHYRQPNPQIDFQSSPFFVCDSNRPWPRGDEPRLAGVSSFGVGGTNAHVVLEEAPIRPSRQTAQNRQFLIPVSAKTELALQQNAKLLAEHLDEQQPNLADVATTLICGRDNFRYRGFVVASDYEGASKKISNGKSPAWVAQKAAMRPRDIVFMFPGQGAQYVRMGHDLYQQFPLFRESMDECSEILRPQLGRDLREILFPAPGEEDQATAILGETQFTQPALFSIGYSLARLMSQFGVEPNALIGHSIGEFAAACFAGVISLEDGLSLIARRGSLMQALPEGSMMSVRIPGAEVEPKLFGQLAISSFNGPRLCVVAGPDEEIAELRRQLESDKIVCKYLHTSHAFHSPMMDSIVDPFADFVGSIKLNPPAIPILSTVTGQWLTDQQAIDPRYWAEHLRNPVRFSDAVTAIWLENESAILIELGPRRTLATLALQHASDRKTQLALTTMSDNADDHAEVFALLTALGKLWAAGATVDLQPLTSESGRKIPLPTYAFERKRFFVQPGNVIHADPPRPIEMVTEPKTESTGNTETFNPSGAETMSRIPGIVEAIHSVFEKSSGFDLSEFDSDTTFFEMGLDSLVLTQTATALKREFEVDITFRQLLEETTNVGLLAEFLDDHLEPCRYVVEAPAAADVSAPANVPVAEESIAVARDQSVSPVNAASAEHPPQPITIQPMSAQAAAANSDAATAVINGQLQLMAAQLQLLGGTTSPAAPVAPTPAVHDGGDTDSASSKTEAAAAPRADRVSEVVEHENKDATSDREPERKKAFGAAARVNLAGDQLNDAQRKKLEQIIRRTNETMPGSRNYAQTHRRYMADPRTVSGFRPAMKEMTHPIVVDRSSGVHLWDVDGNQYVDYTCGFGSNFLGHGSAMIVDSVSQQLQADFAIGPQSPLAGEVARLFCELTGNQRMAFSNTGSEAVLGCTRLARTFTGKQQIVIFNEDYHGILDEVIVRGARTGKSFPAATGIPAEHVENVVVLEYGAKNSLDYIRENLDQLAAVLVEPVQSRHPELQPREFLTELRSITEDVDTALIFDEVITGFRIAPGGAQQHFGIRADLASYGKVVGGGLPIGLIGGRSEYMDGLDGGFWQYGDDSRPEAGMTYFAGTFVRHPLTLAASRAILQHIQREGQPMYDRLNALSDDMARQLNQMFEELQAPLYLANFGSLFKVQFQQELPWSELIFAELRLRGFHIWDHRPCLLTVSHQQEHVDAFLAAFRSTILELQRAGFVPGEGYRSAPLPFDADKPPVPDARLGNDRSGNPGWFVADELNPGQFIQVGSS